MSTEYVPVARFVAKANHERSAVILTVTDPAGREQSFPISPDHVVGLVTELENARMLCRAKQGARIPPGNRLVT